MKMKIKSPPQKEDTAEKRRKPGPFLDFLFALLLFIAVILLIVNLIAPNLYSWGFDYTAIHYVAIPILTAVTLYFGYRAQAKLGSLLIALYRRLKYGKKRIAAFIRPPSPACVY